MTVGELAALLLRLPNQALPACLPADSGSPGYPDAFQDPHEVTGASRWDWGQYVDARGRALIRGSYVRLDAAED